jgi:hypothetical protein
MQMRKTNRITSVLFVITEHYSIHSVTVVQKTDLTIGQDHLFHHRKHTTSVYKKYANAENQSRLQVDFCHYCTLFNSFTVVQKH